jgi:molecular chaperone DnaK (HSP70)
VRINSSNLFVHFLLTFAPTTQPSCPPHKVSLTLVILNLVMTKAKQQLVLTEPSIECKERRSKRSKQDHRRVSASLQRHKSDLPSGGLQSLLPSLIGVAVLCCGLMAKQGFRGRASVAGIDLGTTNSVICVQKLTKGVGEIQCIPDPVTKSVIIPSVVSFLDASERRVGPSSKVPSKLTPHPSHVVVGQAAKQRIDSHPHHTLYNAKRVLGRSANDPAIDNLRHEVDFKIGIASDNQVAFYVPDTDLPILPQTVGAYVVSHLISITKLFLNHDNVKAAVICVPAKFTTRQKQMTHQAFRDAGVSVMRVLEEPTAAALAYGLHRKQGVDYILVYDFGGGTLDVSLLHVSEGFVEVMGSDGDDRLGGADFDAAVANFLLEERGGDKIVERIAIALNNLQNSMHGVDLEEALSHSCPKLKETPLCTVSSFHTLGERMKIELSSVYPKQNGQVEAQCYALSDQYAGTITLDSFCSNLFPTTLDLSLQEFDTSVQALYDRSILPMTRVLNDLDLRTDDIDEVVMVGGTTRMPQIRELVRKALPLSQLNTRIDPDITVAYGAASVID